MSGVHTIFPYLLIIILIFFSCKSSSNTSKNITKATTIEDEKHIVTTPIVHKNFVKKNGVSTGIQEMYIRRSIQDYFIKFCESSVSKKEMESHLSSIKGEIKTVTVEVTFRDGNWDICDDNVSQQSRIGEYVIIHRVIQE